MHKKVHVTPERARLKAGRPPSRRFAGTLLSMSLLVCGGYAAYTKQEGLYTVTLDEVYRSVQLDRGKFEYYIIKYNIRNIMNLRGENPDKPWYIEEIKVSAE